MGNSKWVHIMFFLGGLVAAYVLVNAVESIWSIFGKPKDLYVMILGIGVATIGTFVLWRKKDTFAKATDIVAELSKVTWPTRKETSAATIVVIVTVIISSIFLGLFDMVWSWATGVIYS
jgi:preprotein translocase subunit SecE